MASEMIFRSTSSFKILMKDKLCSFSTDLQNNSNILELKLEKNIQKNNCKLKTKREQKHLQKCQKNSTHFNRFSCLMSKKRSFIAYHIYLSIGGLILHKQF